MLQVAIQGELGSNSHMAALRMFPLAAPGDAAIPGTGYELVPCASSFELFAWLTDPASAGPRAAVLPIENSLHGSVFEHFDLLLEHDVRIAGETLLHIRHNIIAAPGVALSQVRELRSHPVALSQCRRWLREHPALHAVSAYDTAGAVKQLMAEHLTDVAGIAPALAAEVYGAQILVPAIEDHAENYTRFLLLLPAAAPALPLLNDSPDKASLAFTLAHEPGTLLAALEVFRDAGLNLTRIESRPVPGKPWEYVFFVDVRFGSLPAVQTAIDQLRLRSHSMQLLGLYRAAAPPRNQAA